MANFTQLDKEILSTFREGKLDDSIKLINTLLAEARSDPDDLGFKIKKQFERLEYNLSHIYNTLYYKDNDNLEEFDKKVSASLKPHNISDKNNVLFIPGKTQIDEPRVKDNKDNKDTEVCDVKDKLYKQADESKYRLKRKIVVMTTNTEEVLPSSQPNLHQLIINTIVKLLTDNFQVDITTKGAKGTLYNLPFNNPRYIDYSELRGKYDYIILFNHINIASYLDNLKINNLEDPRFIGIYTNDIYELKTTEQIVSRMKHAVFLTQNHRDILTNKIPPLKDVKNTLFYTINPLFAIDKLARSDKIIKTCVYVGPNDQSLQLMLAIWPYIYKSVLGAKLEILTLDAKKLKDDKKLNISVHELKNDKQRLMLLKRCGVVIHPCVSRDVVFSEPLIQAQACGCVPIAFNLFHINEQIASQELLINIKDNNELITPIENMILRIKQLLTDNNEYNRFSDICYNFGRSKIHFDRKIFENIFV